MHQSVLIIDGDRRFAESTQSTLAARGVVAHVEPDANIDTLRSMRPNVVLLNVELPRGSGFSICSRIRRDKVLRRTPILLTSSESSLEALERHAASADRADDYARKPVSVEDIVARIGRLLRQADSSPSEGVLPVILPPDAATPAPAVPSPHVEGLVIAPPPPALATEDLSWPSLRVDDAVRVPSTDDLRSTSRATPEERLEQLRALVKQYEAQRRAARDVLSQLDERGKRLSERAALLAEANRSGGARIEQAERQAREADARRAQVEQEFARFQEEITRIFKEKDAEDHQRRVVHKETAAELEQLRHVAAASEERQRDDAQRLRLLQDELDAAHNAQEAAERSRAKVEAELEEERRARAATEARLVATETVADERTEETNVLREEIEAARVEADELRQDLEDTRTKNREAHQEALQQLARKVEQKQRAHEQALDHHALELDLERKAHEEKLEDLARQTEDQERAHQEALHRLAQRAEQERKAQQEALGDLSRRAEQERQQERSRHEALLATVNETHEEEVAALTEERDQARKEAEQAATRLRDFKQARASEREQEERQRTERSRELEEAKERAAALSTQKTDAGRALNQEREKRVALEATNRMLRGEVRQLEEKIAAAQAESNGTTQALKADLSDVSRGLSESQAQVSELQQKLSTTLEERDSARNEVARARLELNTHREKLERMRAAVEERDGRLDDAEHQATRREESRVALQHALEQSRQATAAARSHAEELQKRLDDATALADEREQSRLALEHALGKAREAMASTRTHTERMQSNLTTAHQDLAAHEERIARIKRAAEAAERAKENAERALAEAEREKGTVEQARQKAMQERESAVRAKEAVERAKASADRATRALEQQNEELRTSLKDKKSALVDEARRRSELEVALKRARAGSSAESAGQTRALKSRIRELELERTKLRGDIDQRESQIDEWRFAQSSIRNTLHALEKDLSREGVGAPHHTAQYNLFLNKIARAVSMSLEALDSTDLVTGELERLPLEPPGAPNPTKKRLPRTPSSTANDPRKTNGPLTTPGPSFPPEPATDSAFSDLLSELRAVAGEAMRTRPSQPFTDAFAAEATTTDTRPVRPHGLRSDEPDITEVIDFDGLGEN